MNLAAKRYEVALAAFRRGAPLAAKVMGATHVLVGLHLVSEAQTLVAQGHAKEALPSAERAVSLLVAAKADPSNLASAHAILGKARLATGDKPGARAELEIARDAFKKLGGDNERDLKEAEALLRSI